MQLNIEWNTVHRYENNISSQSVLEARREDFNKGCFKVFKRLMAGERLTTVGAGASGLSGHLPRRIGDLRGAPFYFKIQMDWIYRTTPEGKKVKSHGEYFMSESDKSRAMEVLMKKAKVN